MLRLMVGPKYNIMLRLMVYMGGPKYNIGYYVQLQYNTIVCLQ